jgi:hypothetical protein
LYRAGRAALMTLNTKINTRQLKTCEAIEAAVTEIPDRHQVSRALRVKIGTARVGHCIQIGNGRPGKNTQYKLRIRHIYTLTWHRDPQALKADTRVDGVFPSDCWKIEKNSDLDLRGIGYKGAPRFYRTRPIFVNFTPED